MTKQPFAMIVVFRDALPRSFLDYEILVTVAVGFRMAASGEFPTIISGCRSRNSGQIGKELF